MKKLLIILAILALIFPAATLFAQPQECINYCGGNQDKEIRSVSGYLCTCNCDDYCDNADEENVQHPPDLACICNPLAATEFGEIRDNIVNFIFTVAVVLAPLMIIIAGFLFVTAGGNLEQINRAKAIMIWTAVGFLIILLSRGIMGVIEKLLGAR